MRVYYNVVSVAELYQTDYKPPFGYDKIVEDFVHQTIAFNERPGAKNLTKMVGAGAVHSIVMPRIDMLGTDIQEVVDIIHFFNVHKVHVQFSEEKL
jgi:DNA invertase Pin-like site-specific DNA recombinase